MSGCPLFKSTNKYTRVVVGGYGCLIVIANFYIAVRYFFAENLPQASSMLLLLVFKIWEASYRAVAVNTILIIWSGRKGFLRILSRISTLLSNEDRKKLHILSLVFLIYKIIFLLVSRYRYLWSLYGNLCGSWREGWWSFFWSIVTVTPQLHDWEIISISLLITLLKAIHLAETNVINILGQDLEKVGPKVLYRQLHEILSLKEHFMECVSFLPLFLYCYIFIESVFSIVMLHSLIDNPLESDGDRLTTIILNTRNIITVSHSVLLTLYTHHLNCQSRSYLKKIRYQINTKHDHLVERKVMKMIEKSQKYEYRAADFFVINKELGCTSVSSLLRMTMKTH